VPRGEFGGTTIASLMSRLIAALAIVRSTTGRLDDGTR
jgi:hypothetical protein